MNRFICWIPLLVLIVYGKSGMQNELKYLQVDKFEKQNYEIVCSDNENSTDEIEINFKYITVHICTGKCVYKLFDLVSIDSGIYKCILKSNKTVIGGVNLTVRALPQLISEEIPRIIYAHSDEIKINCELKTSHHFNYEWINSKGEIIIRKPLLVLNGKNKLNINTFHCLIGYQEKTLAIKTVTVIFPSKYNSPSVRILSSINNGFSMEWEPPSNMPFENMTCKLYCTGNASSFNVTLDPIKRVVNVSEFHNHEEVACKIVCSDTNGVQAFAEFNYTLHQVSYNLMLEKVIKRNNLSLNLIKVEKSNLKTTKNNEPVHINLKIYVDGKFFFDRNLSLNNSKTTVKNLFIENGSRVEFNAYIKDTDILVGKLIYSKRSNFEKQQPFSPIVENITDFSATIKMAAYFSTIDVSFKMLARFSYQNKKNRFAHQDLSLKRGEDGKTGVLVFDQLASNTCYNIQIIFEPEYELNESLFSYSIYFTTNALSIPEAENLIAVRTEDNLKFTWKANFDNFFPRKYGVLWIKHKSVEFRIFTLDNTFLIKNSEIDNDNIDASLQFFDESSLSQKRKFYVNYEKDIDLHSAKDVFSLILVTCISAATFVFIIMKIKYNMGYLKKTGN